MSRDFLKRLGKVEEQTNPPEPLKFRIQVSFVRPDRTISSRMIMESGKPNVIIEEEDEE